MASRLLLGVWCRTFRLQHLRVLECCVATLWQLSFDFDNCVKLQAASGFHVLADVLRRVDSPKLVSAQTLAAQTLWVASRNLSAEHNVAESLAGLHVVQSCLALAQHRGKSNNLRMACTRVLVTYVCMVACAWCTQ